MSLPLSGLPGEVADRLTVCAEFNHVELPAGFSVGGAKDFMIF